ncbi:hypothetical protein FAF44_09145 [Nonomuraea sp. MG754425]|uniref:hypothetical protein n=1 Tax=Nonomuraea sp. MG754425 TaxID=2570319 RepID=UPI001F4376D3|nr:hypothetical protein [Nonomuraea sp. MG754425]MCF6468551.1 hypothetical protein [Nonomuraea sp. MG754425]
MKILTAFAAAATLIAVPAPAQAATPACPAPSQAELKETKTDKPAHGAKALKGVRVQHLPKGFVYGQVVAAEHDGVTEYGYRWSDDRDSVDRRHRSLWVRVVCWPKADKPASLTKLPVTEGRFANDPQVVKLGGRKVLSMEGDGALGHGRYVGWVHRQGVVVTVMASRPLAPELAAVIKGIKL